MKKFYFLLSTCFLFNVANAQIINFPDANFKAKLLQPNVAFDQNFQPFTLDANSNGEIEVSEAQLAVFLDVSGANISDLTGISNFAGLKNLSCGNNLLTTLTIDSSIILTHLDANHNALTSVNVNFDPVMDGGFDLSYNNLTSFTIAAGFYYETVNLSHNQLTSLSITDAHFEYFDISYNNLTALSIIGTAYPFYSAKFSNNHFSTLNLSNVDFAYDCILYLGNNTVDNVILGNQPGTISYTSDNTSFDVGNFTSITSCDPESTGILRILNCPNLQYFVLKNGFNHTVVTCNEGGNIFDNAALNLTITNCPSLSFICVDELEQPNIQARINQLGLQNQVQVNTYCTFTPGGTYYTINGATRFDYNTNGCDANDFNVSYQKFNITNGSETGTIISDASGNYSIAVGPNTHIVTPIIESPQIYTASPASVSVNFPTNVSPYLQDFCLTSTGIHPDLEISLIPIGVARPGFDANYKLVYRNKGNQTQSGTVNLNFTDSVLDFVSSNPATTTQVTDALTYDFSNLQPFESRTISLVLNVNSPLETPAVNGGDILAYTASITSLQTDDTPNDNIATLNQTVVSSFDPNDKICLEGTVVSTDEIGQYVHYMIRFENSGTANAQNIVVKDLIDDSKFDIESLIPIDGSAPFVSRITGNQVEFIFENINLPFDNGNNDGYVAFKIKTKSTLAIGDNFSNTANIYFDYNFPIITNTATTNIAVLATKDFEFANYFTLYPNPTNDVLNIQTKGNIAVTSANIYNVLGQLVLAAPNSGVLSKIDVSELKTGNYFIKINSDKGSSNAKFIKR